MSTLSKISLSLVMPALNEEENLRAAVEDALRALDQGGIDGEVVVVNDGSCDQTGQIAEGLCAQHARVRVIHHSVPMGVGRSFRDGALAASKEAVTYLPGDGENDPWEVIKYAPLLQHVEMVVPFVVNKEVRSRLRRFLSATYRAIVNAAFGTSFNYTNGNVIYRTALFRGINARADSFFFQTECVMRLACANALYAEVPIRIRGRQKGKAKALRLKSFFALTRDFLRLFWELRVCKACNQP